MCGWFISFIAGSGESSGARVCISFVRYRSESGFKRE